jgi:pyridoxal phosphate enzyme (YggS family)
MNTEVPATVNVLYTGRVVDISGNLLRLRQDIENKARACGREASSVRILAVTKTFPPEAIEKAHAAGQVLFGENRVQEAESKIPRVRGEGLSWHLVGHLQSNKARRAVELFEVIETIDSEKIAGKIARCCQDLGKRMKVFIQVNVGEESQKFGFPPTQVREGITLVDRLPSIDLVGLMAIPPFHEDPEHSRPYFKRVAALLEEVNEHREIPLTELSMGMSGDFPVAVEEGSTLVRLGSAIFGLRNQD